MKKVFALCVVLAMALTLFAGCTSDSSSAGTPDVSGSSSQSESGSDPVTPTAGGEVVVNLASEPPEMNSILTTSTGSMNVLRHIVDGLVILDQNDAPAPGMAESWTISDDNLTYTFTIRQGATWSNGEPVTAHDFVFAWTQFFTADTAAQYASTWAPLVLGAQQMLDPENYPMNDQINAALLENDYTEGIGFKAVDDYTLQVTSAFPCAYFLDVMAFPSFMPVNEKAYNEIGADAYGTEVDNIVTNGAFKLTSWAHESNIVLEKNQDYWDAANIKLDKITMEMISDTGTALNGFVAGELDMIGLNATQADQMLAEGREVQYYDDGSCWYFEFNNSLPGLKNVKVRKALTMAIDAEAFIASIVRNNSKVAYSFTPYAISNAEFAKKVEALNLYPRVADGDYSEIKALFEEGLAEEGMTAADLKLSIITDEGDTARNNVAFFQEQWKVNLGIDVQIEQMTYQQRLDRMTQKDFSIVYAGWGPDYNDPMTFLDLFVTDGGNNHTWFSNSEYDKLIEEALTEADFAKREQMLLDVEKIIGEQFPVGPIYNRSRAFITSERFTGVVRTAFDDMNFRWAEVVG